MKFILSYEGSNPAVLRLQMRLMCWDVDIVHRPETKLVHADYWSRLGVDLEYDLCMYNTCSRLVSFVHYILLLQTCPCCLRTCLIIGDLESNSLRRLPLLKRIMYNLCFWLSLYLRRKILMRRFMSNLYSRLL